MAYFNVYIENSRDKRQYMIALNDQQINKLVQAYLDGEKSLMVKGVERDIYKPLKFIIYSINPIQGLTGDQASVEQNLRKYARIYKVDISQKFFTKVGSNITDSLTGGKSWGGNDRTIGNNQTKSLTSYISPLRLEELKSLKSKNFDLIKLIRLIEEVNENYSNKCFFATGALVRSIMDHIPPIFGMKNFDEVTNNYSPPGRSKSFKESMEHLNKSMRKISDKIVHSQITNSETLPNETQVDCRRDLDVLLEEIVRVLKYKQIE